MKRIYSLLMALALVMSCACSCRKEPSKKGLDVTGVWELTEVSPITKSAMIGDRAVDVFLQFSSDGSFAIHQKLGDGAYKVFTGTWTLTGNTLDGVYSDKKAWGSTYTVEREGDMMTLASKGEVYSYKKIGALPSSRF